MCLYPSVALPLNIYSTVDVGVGKSSFLDPGAPVMAPLYQTVLLYYRFNHEHFNPFVYLPSEHDRKTSTNYERRIQMPMREIIHK